MKNKRGLVVIYDPHALMQFLNFYCMDRNSEIQWSALCLPKENGEEVMHAHCEKADIFEKVYRGKIEFIKLPIWKKGSYFAKMLFWALLRKQEIFAQKMFRLFGVDAKQYDYYAANTESGFMAGLMASFAKDKSKTTIYFEDGSADYMIDRKKGQSFFRKGSFENFQCVCISKLGYCGKGYTYFEPSKRCIKYASVPDELMYNNYKEINRFSLDDNSLERYKEILLNIYPELNNYANVNSNDVTLVFTVPMNKNNKFSDVYIKRFQEYLDGVGKTIYLKKHPRDEEEYVFNNNVVEISQDIPAELIFPYFKGAECYMMEPDSLVINMEEYDLHLTILYGEDYQNEQTALLNTWGTKENFIKLCERFVKNNYKFKNI